MAQEIELKLCFPESRLAGIVAHPLVQAGTPLGAAKTLDNTYFDTPELQLHAERVAIRIRRAASGVVQTIKCAAPSVGGLSSRPEWEQPYDGSFALSAIDNASVRTLLEGLAAHLVPAFSTVFERQTRRFEPRPGVVILMMIDHGQILAAGRAAPIAELELELVEGEAADLQRFAIELAENLPLLPVDRSKAERGYRLFLGQTPGPRKSTPTPLDPTLTPSEAFVTLARALQAAWQENQFGAVMAGEAEYIHQFRVALRRLSTLLKVFAPCLDAAAAETWVERLKAVAAQAGKVRDLDVMLETILKPLQAGKLAKPDRQLVGQAIVACKQARKRAAAAECGQLERGALLLRFSREIPMLTVSSADREIRAFAQSSLVHLHARALKRLTAVRKSRDPECAHRLRIALKHLRYSCEFFQGTFEPVAMRKFANAVAGLQDQLGLANDLHVTLACLDEWSKTDPALGAAAECVARCHAGAVQAQIDTAVADARSLLEGPLPWQTVKKGAGPRKA